ncbi:MAG: HNH endonuclease signature motif containing protein [Prosthecobacter sp.]|nr:HNH endonuclease signature motif containing protein [Prosthecobacter sp.]
MEPKQFIEQFQDHLAPKLDTYEQALYLYIFRHSRLLGADEVVIGFKSARKRMACGLGQDGRPMSESTAYEKLRSLQSKGCIEVVASENTGSRYRLRLPDEMPGIIPEPVPQPPPLSIDEMDFFEIPENRTLILEREEHHCFYCLRVLTTENYVIEHVVSRPVGDNGYRNLVAACRECNNRKSDLTAEDYLRALYRESFLSASELQDRLLKLGRLRNGELKPMVKD